MSRKKDEIKNMSMKFKQNVLSELSSSVRIFFWSIFIKRNNKRSKINIRNCVCI